MKLKYFNERRTENGWGIVLEDNVFSITKDGDKIVIREECDGYYHEEFTKEQAIEIFKEAIAWIESGT